MKWKTKKNAPRKRWFFQNTPNGVMGKEVFHREGKDFSFHVIELDNGERRILAI